MTGSECFLDTSVIIHYFKGHSAIIESLNSFDEVFVSSTVAGELYYGAFASSNSQKHIDQVQSFLTNCIIYSPDISTAIVYGKLKAHLKRNGTPIPENDIWIAAMAVEHKKPLFTTDKHFGLLEIELISI